MLDGPVYVITNDMQRLFRPRVGPRDSRDPWEPIDREKSSSSMPNTHRRRRRDSAVELSCAGDVNRRLPTDSVDNLETDQTDSVAV